MSVSLGTVTSFNVGAGVGNTSYTAGSESVLAVLCGVEGSGLSGATCLGAGTATLQNYTSGGGYCLSLIHISEPTRPY